MYASLYTNPTYTLIVPFSFVYLIAFEIIFKITLSIAYLSAFTGGTFAVTKHSTLCDFFSITNFSLSIHILVKSPQSNTDYSLVTFLLSYLESINKSVTSFAILLASELITSKNLVCISLSYSLSSKVSAYPIIDVIGVFSS